MVIEDVVFYLVLSEHYRPELISCDMLTVQKNATRGS
jgi:hypothetical protein